MKKMDKK